MRSFFLLALAALSTLGYLSFFFFPVLDPPHAVGHTQLALLLAIPWLLLFPFLGNLQQGRLFWTLFGASLLWRLLLMPHDPSMSDDAYRYIWDGKVQAQGFNPYEEPPTSPFLTHLHDATIHPFINHRERRTIYPPLAQVFFFLSYILHPSGFWGLKFLLFVADLVTLALFGVWLRWRSRPIGWLLAYAWCPLVLLEIFLEAHVDGFALPFLVGLILAVLRAEPLWIGSLLACVILIKPQPILLWPVLVWHFRGRRAFQLSLVSAFVGLAFFLPYFREWLTFLREIAHFSRHWYFNGPLFTILDIWLLPEASRAILLGLLFLAVAAAPFLRRLAIEQRLLLPLAAYLLLSPTLYPWYLLWLIPWVVIRPSSWLLWLVAILPLAHTVHAFQQINAVWELPFSFTLLQFAPALAFALTSFLRSRTSDPSAGA